MAEGDRFGNYILIKRLAVGGMAEVHLAKTEGIEGFEKYLAVKIVHPRFAEDPEIVKSLIGEAKIAVQLSHVNIGQIFDLGKVDGRYYVSMEYIDGYDLFKIMSTCAEKDIHVPFEVAAFIAHEVCAGLYYAHNRLDRKGRALNLIHRDVSPQNIMVSHQGEVKLVDFGIAKISNQISRTETAIGVIKGKFYYMSPEQASAEKLDCRSDLYSLGICTYEMIAGHMLYHDEQGPNDAVSILEKIRKSRIPPLKLSRTDCPPELERMVFKALQKQQIKRYQSAREYQMDLTRFLFKNYASFNRSVVADFMQRLFGETTTQPEEVPEVAPQRVFGTSNSSSILSRNEYNPTNNSVIFQLNDLPGTQLEVANNAQARVIDKQELRTELLTKQESDNVLQEMRPSRSLRKKRNEMRAMANEMPTRIVDEGQIQDMAVDFGSVDLGSLDLDNDDSGPKTIIDPRYVDRDEIEVKDIDLVDFNTTTGSESQELEVDLDALLAKVDEKLAPAELPTSILDTEGGLGSRNAGPPAPKPVIDKNQKRSIRPTSSGPPLMEKRPGGNTRSNPSGEVVNDHLSRFQVSQENPVVQQFSPIPHTPTGGFRDTRLPVKLLAAGTGFLALFCALLAYLIFFRPSPTPPTTGKATLRTVPSEAAVFINGERQSETTPVTLELTPGKYRLSFTKKGYKQTKELVVIKAGQTHDVSVKLELKPGKIFVLSEPDLAQVWVGGAFRGRTPMVLDDIKHGQRLKIAIRKAGYYKLVRSVTLEEGKLSYRLKVKLEKVR